MKRQSMDRRSEDRRSEDRLEAENHLPEPLSPRDLAEVPGILGNIARERYEDYRGAPLVASGERAGPASPGFGAAVRSPGLSIIAEIKRASPSQGAIAALNPAEAAMAYREGGAAALSVLTEGRHFGGELAHISEVREVVSLPVLRKDFTVHPLQLLEASRVGASAVLLIVALCGVRTGEYLRFARSLGLDALVEVHDEAELETAMAAGAEIIGINNRDLRSLEIDLQTAPRLLEVARESGHSGLLVAESGYRRREELLPLQGVADAVLVGTSLAGAGDLTNALRELSV